MSEQAPFFRYDLETNMAQEGSERFVDVNCPESGKAYRLYEVEYAVACGMDGRRSPAELVVWAKDELGLETSESEVTQVIGTLAGLGYLESADAAQNVAAASGIDVELGNAGVDSAVAAVASKQIPVEHVELGNAGSDGMSAPFSAVEATDSPEAVELGRPGSQSDFSRAESPSWDEEKTVASEIVEEMTAQSTEIPDTADSRADSQSDFGRAESPSWQEDKTVVVDDLSDDVEPAEEGGVSDSSLFGDADLPAAAAAAAAVQASAPVQIEDSGTLSKGAAASAKNKPAPVTRVATYQDRQSAPIGLWLALLAAVGAGGWYVYQNFIKPNEETPPPAVPELSPKQDDEAAKPLGWVPGKSVRLTFVKGSATDFSAPADANLSWVAENESKVAQGELIAHLKGYEASESRHIKSLEALSQAEQALADLGEDNNSAKKDRAQTKVARLSDKVKTEAAVLADLSWNAPTSGVIRVNEEAKSKVKAGDVLLTIQDSPHWGGKIASASIENPEETIEVASQADPDQSFECQVTHQTQESSHLRCTADEGTPLADTMGTEPINVLLQ